MGNNKKYSFLKLAPTDDADLGIYENALDFSFKNDDVLNIAISGAYGAGKSSIIETYKKKNSNKMFLHISLAYFEKEDKSEIGNAARNLEGKIINQLIHQIETDRIPQTRFKTKEDISEKELKYDTAKVAIFTLLLIYNWRFEDCVRLIKNLDKGILKNILSIFITSGFQFISFLLLFGIGVYAIYSTISLQRNKSLIKKAVAKDFEIEVLGEDDSSYFDKYLNEVLYLFRKSNADAIVFEDIDRFNDINIFEKLREINTLVNNKINNNQNIRFIYLLRDDIFISKDRTKFFDILIPVIPITDGSNSYDKFIDHFTKGNIIEHFDHQFLREVSLYVDEYRLLKNIYNEYLIYHDKLDVIQLSYNKLLSMVIYKNIFPRDFALLQLNKGYVKYIFNQLNDIRENEIEKISNNIEKLEASIKEDKLKLLYRKEELEALYIQLPEGLRVNGNYSHSYDTRLDFFRALKNNEGNIYLKDYYNRYSEYNDFTSQLTQAHNHPDFIEKISRDENKIKEQMEDSRKKIINYHRKINNLKESSLQDLITRDNVDEIFSIPSDIPNDLKIEYTNILESHYFKLVVYLIRNGYIDELSYADYISYFYENSITRQDKIYLRSLTDQVACDFNHTLQRLNRILDYLTEKNFKQVEILNFDLLSYLLSRKDSNMLEFKNFMLYLRTNEPMKFIIEFIESRRYLRSFMPNLIIDREDIIDNIIASNYPYESKKLAIISALYFTDCTLTSKAKEQISKNADFLDIMKIEVIEDFIDSKEGYQKKEIIHYDSKFLANRYAQIGVKIQFMDTDYMESQLYQEVYERSLYCLTADNIEILLKVMYGNISESNIWGNNYTLISSNKEQPLYNTVNNNFNDYIEIVIDKVNNEITDTEESALHILNATTVSQENKINYIQKLHTTITLLNSIEDNELWTSLLDNQIVVNNENTILEYYFHGNGMNPNLVDFINLHKDSYSISNIALDDIYGDDAKSKLFDSIINLNSINDIHYKSLLQQIRYIYKNFSILNIGKSKIDILIELKIITMTKDNLLFIRETYPDNLYFFIENNLEKYVDIIDEETFDERELIYLLPKNNITDASKISLLEYTESPLTYNITYSDDVKKHIVNHNFAGDYEKLIKNYSSESSVVQISIKSLIIKDIDAVIKNNYILPYELINHIIDRNNINDEQITLILTLSIDTLSIKEIQEIFTKINSSLQYIFNNKQATIEKNNINRNLLKKLEKRNIISSFKTDNRNEDLYRTYPYIKKIKSA